MDMEALKPGDAPSEPAYSAPTPAEIVLPEENDEPDQFDEEAGVDGDHEPDFDVEETNPKEVQQ